MLRRYIKFTSQLVLSFVIVVTLRVILVIAIGYSYPPYLQTLKMTVISDLLYVLAALVLEMILFYLSVCVIYATTEWITVLYIPILMYSIFNTYFSCIAYKFEIAKNKEIKQFFTDKWHDFLFRKDPFWLQIQRDLNCCGLDGPRTFLDFLRKVHPSCYVDNKVGGTLITPGCHDIIDFTYRGVRVLAVLLNWFLLIVQLIILIFYIGWICQIYTNLIYPKSTRLQIYRTYSRRYL